MSGVRDVPIRRVYVNHNLKPSAVNGSGPSPFNDSQPSFTQSGHAGSNKPRHFRKEETPWQIPLEADPVNRGRADGTNSPYPRWDFGTYDSTLDHDVNTMEDLRNMVLGEFKDVFQGTARHCVLDTEFESENFPFEQFFLKNLAHGSVMPLGEDLYSDSEDPFPPATRTQYKKSSYENRIDVIFDRLTLSYQLSEDTVILQWTSMVDRLPRYLRSMISSYLLDLPLEQQSLPSADRRKQRRQWINHTVYRINERLRHFFHQCQEGQTDKKQKRPMADWLNAQSEIRRCNSRKRSWLLLKASRKIRQLDRFLRYRQIGKRSYLYTDTDVFRRLKEESELIIENDPEIPNELLFESIYIPTKTASQESLFTIPYESFNGSMLGPSFQITRTIGRDLYGDVYQIEDLSRAVICTAKAYRQAYVSKKDRMYKARSIRRREKWPTYMGCIEQSGMKFLVFQGTTVDALAHLLEQPVAPLICGFSNISVTFNTDFPKLPQRPISILGNQSINREKARTHKKESFAVKPGVPTSRTYAYVAGMPPPAQKERPKTVHQFERKKVRQREKRQRKRAEIAKLRTGSENAT